jgi:phospholipid/cholesterol/gamma-HCH transport system ATP-binding protein
MSGVLSLQGIHSVFGGKEIHKGVSFEIAQGEITALIGGSGSGKSTLLKIVLGLAHQTQGEVSLFGRNLSGLSREELQKVRNRYGVLFQNGALFSALTVGENIAVPLREQTTFGEREISEIIALRLALSGLSAGDQNKMPSDLSGGMRKRAALARALALEPELLFLDEPTSGLDPINARAFDTLIRTLSRSLGLSVLMITHDLGSINLIADKVLVLGEGKLIAQGTVEEVRATQHPWIEEYFSSGPESTNIRNTGK